MKYIRCMFAFVCRSVIIVMVFLLTAIIFSIVVGGKNLTPDTYYDALVTGIAVGVVVQVIYYTIKVMVLMSRSNRLERHLVKHGYSDDFYNKIEKRCHCKSEIKALKVSLFYSRQLVDGEKYEMALEVIKAIDVKKIPSKLISGYYSHYYYVLVMAEKLDDAATLYELAEEYISKTQLGILSHGIYNYAKEDYTEAEEYLLRVKFYADKYTRQTAKLFVALCYIKCNKKKEARDIVSDLISVIKNPVLKKNLTKLMRLIEIAYNINTETQEKEETVEEGNSQDAGNNC